MAVNKACRRLGSRTMLAEIFMLRLETISQASKETATSENSRFVPFTLRDFNSELLLECSKSRGRSFLEGI